MRTVIEGCAIATVDAAGTEYRDGHIVIEDERIVAVGEGPAPDRAGGVGGSETRRIDGRGHLATPGLVNCHHHLYQWATRGLAQQATLFEWLVELYPVWALIDADTCRAAARAGLAALARSGCSASTDHHYVFPRGAGDLLEVEIGAAASIGLRFHPCRGSMDLGQSDGGLPPDEVVEDRDAILAASETAISRFHDPSPGAMVRIALAPCSPFSVTPRADDRCRRAGAPSRRAPAHASGRDARRGALLSGALRRAPRRLPRRSRLAGRRRLACALCAPRRCRDRPLRCHRNGRRPLPKLKRAAGCRNRTGRRAGRRRRRRRPRRRRRRVERGRRLGVRDARGTAVRPARRWPAGVDGAPGPRPRHDRRCALPRTRRRNLVRSRSASSPTWRSGASTASKAQASTIPSRRSSSAPRKRSSCCSWVGARSSREASCVPPTRRRWRSRSRGQAGGLPTGRRLGYDDRSHRPDERTPARSGAAAGGRRRHHGASRRHPEGQGRVRVLLGHADGWDAVGRDVAQRTPARGHLGARHLARAGDPRRARSTNPRGRPRSQAVRHGARRPAGARLAARSLRGRADRDRCRRRPGDGPTRRQTRSRSTTTCWSR